MISLPTLNRPTPKGTTVVTPNRGVQVLKMPWAGNGRLIVNQLTGLYHWNGKCLGRELSIRIIDIKPIAVSMWETGYYVYQPKDGGIFDNIVDSFESSTKINGVWGILYKVWERQAGTTTLFTSPYTMYTDGRCCVGDQIKLVTERVKGMSWFRPVIIHK